MRLQYFARHFSHPCCQLNLSNWFDWHFVQFMLAVILNCSRGATIVHTKLAVKLINQSDYSISGDVATYEPIRVQYFFCSIHVGCHTKIVLEEPSKYWNITKGTTLTKEQPLPMIDTGSTSQVETISRNSS